MFKSRFRISLAFISLLTLPTMALLATPFDPDGINSTPTRARQTLESLPDEIHLFIFSFLNQKDIPSVTRTNQRWKNLMDDNQLWKGYAKRAFIIMNDDRSQDRDYKALVKEHCMPSFTDLGSLNGGAGSVAKGISFDGSVIVGMANDGAAQDQLRAFRWTAERGMESLDVLNGGTEIIAQGTSFDGTEQNQRRAFRRTREKGMESLGVLNGGTESVAQGISFDGSVIIGYAHDGAAQNRMRAFRWTAEKGMESVEKVLTAEGPLPLGWELTTVNAITPSGTVLIGEGEYNVQVENGENRSLRCAWRAVIPRSNLF